MTQDRDPLRFDPVADAAARHLTPAETARLRARLRRQATMTGTEFIASLRDANVAAGRTNIEVGTVHWLPEKDWDPAVTVVSKNSGRHVFLTLIEARLPGTGAFARLIDGLAIEMLIPVVVAPTPPLMPILENWHWQKSLFGTSFETREDRWSPSKSWLDARSGAAMAREKPRYGDACNNCGHCCRAAPQACALGAKLFKTRAGAGPCPALRLRDPGTGRATMCGLAVDPAAYVDCGSIEPDELAAAAKVLIGTIGICDAAMTGDRPSAAARAAIAAEAARTDRAQLAQAKKLWWQMRAKREA